MDKSLTQIISDAREFLQNTINKIENDDQTSVEYWTEAYNSLEQCILRLQELQREMLKPDYSTEPLPNGLVMKGSHSGDALYSYTAGGWNFNSLNLDINSLPQEAREPYRNFLEQVRNNAIQDEGVAVKGAKTKDDFLQYAQRLLQDEKFIQGCNQLKNHPHFCNNFEEKN